MAMAAALALALAACGGNAGSSASSSASGESASASSASASAGGSSMAQALEALDGVTSVEAIDVSDSQVYAEKYLVTFEQPLDHKDPSAGTFPQRVEVGIVPDAQTNVMETDGYLLFDQQLALAPALKQFVESQGSAYRAYVTEGNLFDLAVSELAVQEWQANQETSSNPNMDVSFEGMKEVLAMPEGTDDEKNAKLDAELQFLYFLASPSDWAANSIAWPYYVGAATQYGQYHYDFSYLRQACEAAGLGDVLTVRPEDEEGLLFKMVFTPEQQQAIAYDGTFYEGVTKWVDTTDAKIIFIYGNSDPWYSLRMHDTGNPNVKMYVSNTKPHSVRITDFDQATMQEIGTFASEALLGK